MRFGMKYILRLSSVALLSCLIFSSAAAMSKDIDKKPISETEDVIAQSVYQDKVWPAIKRHVPKANDRKYLICFFSKARNLTPLNILLGELYGETFGDGVSKKVTDFLEKNSYDFTYQFHLLARENGAVRIKGFDTRGSNININYVVDFYPNERYDFISYGKLPRTDKSQEEILQLYRHFLPGVLQKKCIENYQYLER